MYPGEFETEQQLLTLRQRVVRGAALGRGLKVRLRTGDRLYILPSRPHSNSLYFLSRK